jgi:cell division protein FtsQ
VVLGGFLMLAALWFLQSAFPIQKIVLYGKFDRVPLSEVQSQIYRQLKGNFFTADLMVIHNTLVSSPWIRQVKVYRRWPGTVIVAVEEQQPIARWKLGGLINQHGEWFDAYDDRLLLFDGHEQAFPELATLLGKFDYSLKKANINLRKVQFNARRSWSFEMMDGQKVELGQHDTARRLERLINHWPLLKNALNQDVRYVLDMRYPNGLAVGVRETL